MKLKFIKQNDELSVEIVEDKKAVKFDYIYFIDTLYKTKVLDDPLFEGDFLDSERNRVVEMVNDLKKIIVPRRKARTV